MRFSLSMLALTVTLAPLCAAAACASQRGGEAMPLDRRYFHEVPPPAMSFATPPEAGVEDAAPPDAEVKPAPHPKRDAGSPWAAPRSGYLEQLGAEFRRLRPLPMSEYDVSHSKGRKRAVMNELGHNLVRASRDTVFRIMGKPDAIVKAGSPDWGPTQRQDSRAVERLKYQWRGWKDYLMFDIDSSNSVLRSEWFLSSE
jgi:hypothetical protein